jgi:gluconate 5-dehydrogenase
MTAVTLERSGERIVAATPLHRVGNDQDLKGIAVLFASAASAYITGQVIAVDGGMTAI